MTVSTGSTTMVESAIGRVPIMATMDAVSPDFVAARRRLPAELDALAAVLLEHDVDGAVRDALLDGYLVKRLEDAYAAGSTQHARAQVSARSLMREFE